MDKKTIIRCPNCGDYAQRFLSDRLPNSGHGPMEKVLHTECAHCDYLMVMCVHSGNVHLPSVAVTTSSPSRHSLYQDLLLSR